MMVETPDLESADLGIARDLLATYDLCHNLMMLQHYVPFNIHALPYFKVHEPFVFLHLKYSQHTKRGSQSNHPSLRKILILIGKQSIVS
jgi:hypothetical protein